MNFVYNCACLFGCCCSFSFLVFFFFFFFAYFFHFILFYLFCFFFLLKQAMETINVTDEFKCHRKCIAYNTFKLFDLHPPKSNSMKKMCETNNQTHRMKPKLWKPRGATNYHGSVEVSLICVLNKLISCSISIFKSGNNSISRRVLAAEPPEGMLYGSPIYCFPIFIF